MFLFNKGCVCGGGAVCLGLNGKGDKDSTQTIPGNRLLVNPRHTVEARDVFRRFAWRNQ